MVNGKIVYTIFSTTDPVEHAHIRRPIAKYYSQSSVLTFEPHVDKLVDELCRHLESRFIDVPGGPEECDLGKWIGFCEAYFPCSLRL